MSIERCLKISVIDISIDTERAKERAGKAEAEATMRMAEYENALVNSMLANLSIRQDTNIRSEILANLATRGFTEDELKVAAKLGTEQLREVHATGELPTT